MKFAIFEKLSKEEANNFLNNYLSIESDHLKLFLKHAPREGIKVDFSVESTIQFIMWLKTRLVSRSAVPEFDLPEWIVQSSSYQNSLFEFDQKSERMIIFASYYLGETFVRNYNHLKWSIGKPKTALMNMPTIAGFRFNLEMPVMLVCNNLFSRMAFDNKGIEDVMTAINYWNGKV